MSGTQKVLKGRVINLEKLRKKKVLTKLVEKLSTIKTEDEPKKESKRISKNKSSDSKE